MAASYTCKEQCNDEEPVPDLASLPTEQGHRMPDGTVHPIQVGLRMVEEFRTRVRENIEADPLRAVAIAYEEELTRIKEQLGEGGDLEEFTALCPTLCNGTQHVQVFDHLCHVHDHDHLQLEKLLHPPNTSHSN